MCDSSLMSSYFVFFFFFNDTATTEIYTLSLHDALPIFRLVRLGLGFALGFGLALGVGFGLDLLGRHVLGRRCLVERSEEHTSELQSRQYLVCRLLLEKKKN